MRTLKKFFFLCLVFFILLVGALLALIYYTDINRFKPLIMDEFRQATGLQLLIDGKLTWSFYPELGLEARHLTLRDPAQAGKNKLAEVKSISFGVEPFSILQGKVRIESINASELVVYTGKSALKLNISLTAQGYLDLIHKYLKLSKIDGTINNLSLKGEALVSNVAGQAKLSGHFSARSPDFKQWLQQAGVQTPALQAANQVQGDFNFTTRTTFQSLGVNGTIKVRELKLASLSTQNLSAQTRLKSGVLTLAPIQSSLYQGSLKGTAKVDLNKAQPQFSFQGSLNNVQTEGMLANLTGPSKIRLSGRGNLTFQIRTAGVAGPQLIRNLNGSGKLNVANGSLKGIDMVYQVFSAYALINQQPPPKNSLGGTDFANLTGSFVIKNGVLSNNDLNLTTSLLQAKGKGTLDFNARKINYQILASTKGNVNQKQESVAASLVGFVLPLKSIGKLNQLTIPVYVSGNLDRPLIRIDKQSILAQAAKQHLTGAVGGKVLQSVIPGLQVLPLLQVLPGPGSR